MYRQRAVMSLGEMSMFVRRLYNLVCRRLRARRLGFHFGRGATWELPSHLFLNGTFVEITAPRDNGTKVAFMDIILDDCYGLERACRRMKIQTVLDIGAHAGLFSLHARNYCPTATIHAYEPNPAMSDYLTHHAMAARFQFYMEAVGSEAGKVTVQAHPDSVQTVCRMNDEGEVQQVPFSSCIERLGGRVDFLKLDCEGAEWDLFLDRDSWRNVSYLGMEYHLINGHSRNEVIDTVRRLGFVVLQEEFCGSTYGLLSAVRR